MKTLVYTLLALLGCNSALANSNFVSNPRLTYPPACAHVPTVDASTWLDEHAVKFYEKEIQVYDAQAGEKIPLGLKAYRSPCSEPGRSLIWLQFSLSEVYAERNVEIELPAVYARFADNWSTDMSLVAELNGWWSDSDNVSNQTYLTSKSRGRDVAGDSPYVAGERKWVFLLDGAHTLDEWWYWKPWLSATKYNASFKLEVDSNSQVINVPATTGLMLAPAPSLPLSGRHSGTWVIDGARDQGFQLAISDQVGVRQDSAPGVPDLPLVIFLTQYTFDAQGNMLWLSGAAEFEPGASAVTIPIERVSNGEFRGSKKADREIVGSVTITSNSCNDLGFEFDYSSLGLGQGVRRLQRIFSLETAGFDCRDYEARVTANH